MNPLLARLGAYIRERHWLKVAALRLLPDWHINRQVPGIGVLRIRIRRHRSFWLRHPLVHEQYAVGILQAFVRPGDVVWDVGANIGLITRTILRLGQPRLIVAFEPMPENITDLLHNIRLSEHSSRCVVKACALGDSDGEVSFQVDDIQSATGTLDKVGQGRAATGRADAGFGAASVRVECRRLDSLLANGKLPAPNVLKIDVEGAERLLLDGGARFFKETSPRLLIETHGVETIRSCLEFLFANGYHVCGHVPNSWNATRHQRLFPQDIERVTDQYDVHFIAASKNAADLPLSMPDTLEALNLS